jgi:hypothetical protein
VTLQILMISCICCLGTLISSDDRCESVSSNHLGTVLGARHNISFSGMTCTRRRDGNRISSQIIGRSISSRIMRYDDMNWLWFRYAGFNPSTASLSEEAEWMGPLISLTPWADGRNSKGLCFGRRTENGRCDDDLVNGKRNYGVPCVIFFALNMFGPLGELVFIMSMTRNNGYLVMLWKKYADFHQRPKILW